MLEWCYLQVVREVVTDRDHDVHLSLGPTEGLRGDEAALFGRVHQGVAGVAGAAVAPWEVS